MSDASGRRPIEGARFLLAANGDAVSPPAAPLRDFLVARGAAVTFVVHPLSPEEGNVHRLLSHQPGRPARIRSRTLPTRVPWTYPLDAIWPPWVPAADVWFGFNNLLATRGLLERRLGRVGAVAYWAVDFVPDRFGRSPLTAVYDRLDAYCARHVDLRVEISAQALAGRDQRLGLAPGSAAPTEVVGIGAWVGRVPHVPEDGYAARRAIFIGHLVPRMGVGLALEAIDALHQRGVDVHLDIAGRGPLEEELREDARRRGIADRVTFHGFVADHEALERLLATASVALAPYVPDPDSFTRFADPSKLKSYVAAGLPTLLTDVPPNARTLAENAGAEITPYDAQDLAAAIERALADSVQWRKRRAQALSYAGTFDWSALLAPALTRLGFQP